MFVGVVYVCVCIVCMYGECVHVHCMYVYEVCVLYDVCKECVYECMC